MEKIAIISAVSQNVYGFLSTKSQIDMQLNAIQSQMLTQENSTDSMDENDKLEEGGE